MELNLWWKRKSDIEFTVVGERLVTIRFKTEFNNVSLICAHALIEEKADVTKDDFCECQNCKLCLANLTLGLAKKESLV